MRKFLTVLICVASVFALGAGFRDLGFRDIGQRIRERGKCRVIKRINCDVRISFMNSEDADLFARDLSDFINKED